MIIISRYNSDNINYSPFCRFGSILSENGFICHSMERLDTLIPEGVYKYTMYDSPVNKRKVPLLHDVIGFEFIEIHPANFPSELKGCTAPGFTIDKNKPAIYRSSDAFKTLIEIMDEEGEITYKNDSIC